jgi:hypothetical protein
MGYDTLAFRSPARHEMLLVAPAADLTGFFPSKEARYRCAVRRARAALLSRGGGDSGIGAASLPSARRVLSRGHSLRYRSPPQWAELGPSLNIIMLCVALGGKRSDHCRA